MAEEGQVPVKNGGGQEQMIEGQSVDLSEVNDDLQRKRSMRFVYLDPALESQAFLPIIEHLLRVEVIEDAIHLFDPSHSDIVLLCILCLC